MTTFRAKPVSFSFCSGADRWLSVREELFFEFQRNCFKGNYQLNGKKVCAFEQRWLQFVCARPQCLASSNAPSHRRENKNTINRCS